MDCFCHLVCPCFSGTDDPSKDYDVIPDKGEYYGDTDLRGAKHGHGMFLFSNGDIYEGEWKKDKMHGFGEYRFNKGEILNGYFENGKYIGDPPPGVQPKTNGSNQNAPRPLTPGSIMSDKAPTKVKQNAASYNFARTMGNLSQGIAKKAKKKKSDDNTDYEERKLLVPPPTTNDRREYQSMQGHADPRVAAQIAMEKEKKRREREARIERIKQKYNIRT